MCVVGLVCWLRLSLLELYLSKIPAWSLYLGFSCLILTLGVLGREGAELGRQPQSCNVLAWLLGEQPEGFIFALPATHISASYPTVAFLGNKSAA